MPICVNKQNSVTIKHESPIPLYIQIKDFIRHNIESGEFAGHTRLPSERKLAQQFDVSRLTVTKALKELELEGLIYAQVGKGTYVTPSAKIDQKLETLSSFTQEMHARRKKVSNRVLSAVIESASDEAAIALKILPGEDIFSLRRIRIADEQAIALEHSHIPHRLCPSILQSHDFERESLYQVLEDVYGLQLTTAYQTVEARLASPDEARALDIEVKAAVLGFTRVTYNHDNQPVEFVLSTYPGERYKLHTILKPTSQP
jgi:GntR family transcriptional regulator